MHIEDPIKELYEHKIYANMGNQDVLKEVPENAYTVLDVGCGAGDNARILKEKDRFVTGITISNDEAMTVKDICDEVIVMDIEREDIQTKKKYDVIILSHICEHLRFPDIVINKLSGSLNENGIIIVALPNVAFYRNRVRLLKGDWSMRNSGPFDNTHLHFYSYSSADAVFSGELKLIRKIPGKLAIPLWPLRKIFPGLCNKLNKSVGKYFPNLFAQQTILVLKSGNHSFAEKLK